MKASLWFVKVAGFVVLTVSLAVSAVWAQAGDCKKAEVQFQRVEKVLTEPADRRYAYEKIVALCPSHVGATVKLAEALRDLALAKDGEPIKQEKLLDESVAHFEKALRLDKDRVEVYTALGAVYWLQGRYGMARDVFKKALALNPSDKATQDELETVELELRGSADKFRSADNIIERFHKASTNGRIKTMGFESYTVPKDRQQFSNILFEEWSYEIAGKESLAQLEEIGKALGSQQMKDVQFVVEGHTDNRGDGQRNRRLSEQRAQAVKNFLVERFGIESSKIVTQGFGYSRPKFPNDSDDNMRQNRRVEIVFQ